MPVSRIHQPLLPIVINIDINEVTMQAGVLTNNKHVSAFSVRTNTMDDADIEVAINHAWEKISPWWPLKNLIATNPLRGFEDLPFEDALSQSQRLFQNVNLHEKLASVNRETIKWCQACFDEGQAVINMPGKNDGVYQAWRNLILHDDRLHQQCPKLLDWLCHLPIEPKSAIQACLKKLEINIDERAHFFTLLLTTLPGWSGYIKYQNEWTQGYISHDYRLSQIEYLAVRIIMTSLLLPDARELLSIPCKHEGDSHREIMRHLNASEVRYRQSLLEKLHTCNQPVGQGHVPDAQLVFCIDVRSERFRRAIETQGHYETFGFAGFFGIPAIIQDDVSGSNYASCPVLVSPKHRVTLSRSVRHGARNLAAKTTRSSLVKKLYRGLKYTFTTPYALAEAIGPWSGLWMFMRTVIPVSVKRIKEVFFDVTTHSSMIDFRISLNDQYQYAESALRIMGLTENFSPLVVLCGHGSSTENNAYASALDCGACGGHGGAANAIILARMLNNPLVRDHLNKRGIKIGNKTIFVAAVHNTTTDVVTICSRHNEGNQALIKLKEDLERARIMNCHVRYTHLSDKTSSNIARLINRRSADWAEIRPEWGLARNAAFIVGSRHLTKNIDLEARAFLHSYDWQKDDNGTSLAAILTAPMVVAQWINCQYLFSTLDNISYGSGSKITHNISGKIGVMQGNASDLMHGLPLQSIAVNDRDIYHQPMRLLTVIQAPRQRISQVVQEREILKKLIGNGWVNLVCLDPLDGHDYNLNRDFSWSLNDGRESA